MKKYYKLIIFILILFLSIGFAYLTVNLNINGTVTFRDNVWDVHLENVVVESESSGADTPTINNDDDTVNFNVSLTRPGDYYEFYVDVVNEGTMDATLDSTYKTSLTGDYLTNLNYNVAYYSDRAISQGDLLRAGQKERIKVRVEYKYDVDSYTQLNDLNLYFRVNYKKTDIQDSNYNPKVWNYEFKGEEDTFTVPKTGTYILEVWGAQGGSTPYDTYTSLGGYGGYSKGSISLTKDSTIYINVGGKGKDNINDNISNITLGGYNGGGTSLQQWGNGVFNTGGGGATHIATTSGQLYSLSPSTSSIIIVAGAGGGSGYYALGNPKEYRGGSGGGYMGNDGAYNISNTGYYGLGGTQNAGGLYNATRTGRVEPNAGTFGKGGDSSVNIGDNQGGGSGGGAGYFGGGGSTSYHGTGGGSGYIGNINLTDKIMYCYNCQESTSEADETHIKTRSTTNVSETPTSNYAKIGDGYARITYIGD